MLTKAVIFLLCAFGGYLVGRIGDYYGGHTNTPHHWIYGFVMVAFGLIYFESYYWWAIFVAGGLGAWLSDLNDFLEVRFYGPDVTENHRFWDID
ncbi:MAG: hypothetical protein NTV48_03245 [Candidatus Vogelbacteria bacterium]|nr:hypothetical protein [Candidatus Vogelbacteria bacterium]